MGNENVLTSEERLLRLALRIAAVTFTVETLVYLVPALIGTIQLLGAGFEAGLCALFVWLHRRAQQARWGLRYFSPLQFSTLAAIAEVLVPIEKGLMGAEEVAQNADGYFSRFEADRKWGFKAALIGLYFYPLATIRPPIPLMARAERLEFIEKRFLRDIGAHRLTGFIGGLVQEMIRLGQQLSYVGY